MLSRAVHLTVECCREPCWGYHWHGGLRQLASVANRRVGGVGTQDEAEPSIRGLHRPKMDDRGIVNCRGASK